MEFNVKILQVREGHVTIEAKDLQSAWAEANRLYNVEGRELPDMEDVGSLKFSIDAKEERSMSAGQPDGPLTREEVEAYLKANGYPHPDKTDCEVFMFAGDKQPLYDEAIRNRYELVDVDRWTHLVDLLKTNISFRAAMLIDNALWEEDYEVLEANSIDDLMDTPVGVLRGRLSELYESVSKAGELPENIWGITAQDVTVLVEALHLKSALAYDAHELEAEPPTPEAKVYMCAGSVKREVYNGTYEDCLRFCEDLKWEYKDENEFEWGLDLDDLREFEELPENVLSALEKNDIGPLKEFLSDATVIEYKGILFDEWTVETEHGSVWSEMCEGCSVKYRGQLFDELSEGGVGACSVKGCDIVGMDSDNEHHYYVDFKPQLIRVAARLGKAKEAEIPVLPKASLSEQIRSASNRASNQQNNVPEHQSEQAQGR